MEKEVFEGFDLTNLNEFSEFMGSRTEEIPIEGENIEQSDAGSDNAFEGFEFQTEELEDGQSNDGEENGDPSSTDISKPKKDSFLTPYAKLLKDEGILQDFDEEKFDGTADGLVEAFRQQVGRHVEEYKQTLDPRIKWLQDNVEQGVPLETLLNIDKQRVEFSKITPEVLSEDKDLQKSMVRQYLKATTNGWSDAKIEREVSRLDDLGELDTEAKESFETLKKLNEEQEKQLAIQAQQEREVAVKQQQEALANFKKTLEDTTEIVPGLQVTPILKDRIFKALTTPVGYDQFGNPMNSIAKARSENPMDFEMKLAYLFEVTKGFKDWSPLSATGKKNAIKEFEEAARKLDYNGTGGVDSPPVNRASQSEVLKAMRIFSQR